MNFDSYVVQDTNLSLTMPLNCPPPPSKSNSNKGLRISRKAKKFGFTLAEVLITLIIIGVVAALTVPPLMQKYQEQVTINKVKKFHSTLSQALPQAIKEYGTIDTWGLKSQDIQDAEKIYQRLFKQYFKIAKDCGSNNIGECISNTIYKNLDGTVAGSYATLQHYYKFVLSDGSCIWVKSLQGATETSDKEHLYIDIFYDTNGKTQPNQWGVDLFEFVGTENSIKVSGAHNSGMNFDNGCKIKKKGWTCTAWVIYKGNMDYLRCPEKLSWDGQSSCKGN